MNLRCLFATTALFAAALGSFAAKPESSGPDTLLRNVYKLHDARKGPFFETKNRAMLEKYFTKELATLIVKDANVPNDEVGALDFDPLYDSQDPQVTNFKIGQVQLGGIRKHADDPGRDGFARVAVTFKDNGEARELRFEFEQQPDKTWRISEIHYPEGNSLLQILRKAYPR